MAKGKSGVFWLFLLSWLLAACGATETPVSTPFPSTSPATPVTTTLAAPSPNLPTVQPTATFAPATTLPTSPTTGARATATNLPALPTATSKPAEALLPRSIEALRARSFTASEIKLERLYEQNNAYIAHLITYQSDGLKISGLMYVPNGAKDKKYPVTLVNHGYFDFEDYDSGWDTVRELRYFARNGYIAIASDYRNYARSDKGDNDREPGYVIDVLNLVESVKKFPQADPTKITLMGHSMGGEIALNAMVVNPQIKAFALFGSMSGDAVDNFYARLKWRGADTPEKLIYGDPAQNSEAYRKMSPQTYFSDITAPVIIHVGSNDTTTPPEWSQKIFNNLKKLNKTTEYYIYPGEGHSLNGAAFDNAMTRTLTFFNRALNS